MLSVRVIPSLLLKNSGLVKTIKFKNPRYIGDPINAVKIFNDKEVDELIFLDIRAKSPNFNLIKDITSECFMPFCYGGGVKDVLTMKELFRIGAEKVSLNNVIHENPDIINEAAKIFGSQAIVISIDARRNLLGKYEVWTHGGTKNTKKDPVDVARDVAKRGAGEILVTSIDKDGTMQGYDINLIKRVSAAVKIPVIACGGAGRLTDFSIAVKNGASAVAAGSMFVYYGDRHGILINYPTQDELCVVFAE